MEALVKWPTEIVGKELYFVLLADGRDFVYLVLMFIELIFRQSSINEQHLPMTFMVTHSRCIGSFVSFDNAMMDGQPC